MCKKVQTRFQKVQPRFDSIPPRSNLAAGSTEASNEVTQTKMLLNKNELECQRKNPLCNKLTTHCFLKTNFSCFLHTLKKEKKKGENGAIKPDLARCTENKAMAHQQRTVGKSFNTILQKASPMFNPA